MGKVPKRLNIVVTDSAMLEWPEIKKLAEQGHTIQLSPMHGWFYLGPTAWRMDEKLKPYLPMAIKAMRKIAYPTLEDNDDTGSDTTDSDDDAGNDPA